jgi:hypothetical protein
MDNTSIDTEDLGLYLNNKQHHMVINESDDEDDSDTDERPTKIEQDYQSLAHLKEFIAIGHPSHAMPKNEGIDYYTLSDRSRGDPNSKYGT